MLINIQNLFLSFRFSSHLDTFAVQSVLVELLTKAKARLRGLDDGDRLEDEVLILVLGELHRRVGVVGQFALHEAHA